MIFGKVDQTEEQSFLVDLYSELVVRRFLCIEYGYPGEKKYYFSVQ